MRQPLCIFSKRAQDLLLGKQHTVVDIGLLETVLPCSGSPQHLVVFVHAFASDLDLWLKQVCWVVLAAGSQAYHPCRAVCAAWRGIA